MRRRIRLFVSAAALLAALALGLWQLWRTGALLPDWAEFETRDCAAFRLEGGRVTLPEGWRSPEELRVQDALSLDLDDDGEDELALLGWRIGSYGRHQPFWVEKNDLRWGQHVYLYEREGGVPRAVWISSALDFPIASWFADERGYLHLRSPDGSESVWGWFDWGLELVEQKAPGVLTLAAAGDVLIHRPILEQGLRAGSFDFLFEHLRNLFAGADLCLLNQESILVSDPTLYGDYPRFGAPLSLAEAEKAAGVDAVSCANNHALDQGAAGLEATLSAYAPLGMDVIGLAREEDAAAFPLAELRGVRLALLGYTASTNGMPVPAGYRLSLLDDEERVRGELRAAHAEADAVLVFVHWGTEYAAEPDEEQLFWARVFTEEGADLVFGAHPHVLQPFELRRREDGHETLIFFSLGNLLSSQQAAACNLGGLARVTLEKSGDGVQILDYQLSGLVTHQEQGRTSVWPLADYTDELAARHSLSLDRAELEAAFAAVSGGKDEE